MTDKNLSSTDTMDRQIVQMQYYRFRYRIELESSSSLIFKNREQILEIVVIFAHVFIEDCALKNFIFVCVNLSKNRVS